jgi:sec-independent protein translocase protein TatC
MSFGDHLDELRRRILRALLGVVVAAIVCLVFGDRVLQFVERPIQEVVSRYGGALVVLKVQESFLTYVKLALIVGLFLASPWVAWQLWSFVGEGLYPNEKKYIHLFAPATFLLFITGVLFCYFIVLPWGLDFLIGFGVDEVEAPADPREETAGTEGTAEPEESAEPETPRGARPSISRGEYLSFFLTISILMGLVFQLPLLMLFLDTVGLVKRRTFARYRRHFLVGAFVVAAMLTPPDPVTQVSVALPIIVLFEGGLLLCRFVSRKDTPS